MAQVRLTKNVDIKNLPFTNPVITRDEINRVIKNEYTYTSIKVTYDIEWEGLTNFLKTYTQTIEDRTNG